jgi:RNA polymerase sigma factor (sigma-70 family)
MKIHPDKAFVQDCIQDIATDLWSKRERLSRDVHVKSYLFKSLRHKMIRQLERRHIQQRHLLVWGQGEQPFDAEFSVETAIIDNEADLERKQQLYASLQSLTPRQQEIIYLRYYQNLEHDQVAIIMKLSKEAVYNLLSSSLKRLKSYWQSGAGTISGLVLLVFGKYF